jgi:hypothetical protein
MLKYLACPVFGLTWSLAAIGGAPLVAQEAVLEQFYGSGVHRYFSGNYAQAVADLTAAIDGGSRDPRAYYFRGLAKLRGGGDAAADFQQGAAMETADTNQYYPVGRSLERVQGSTRMTLERYRALARATALSRQQRRDSERYQQLRRREMHVLRAPVAAPPTAASAIESAPATAQPAAPKAAVTPPAMPKAGTPQPPVPEPPAADPFADDDAKKPAADEPKAAADAPKGDTPAEDMPAEEAPAEEKAPSAEGDDPFANPPPKDDATERKDDAPPAEEPAASEPAPAPTKDEEDPFAEAEPK